MKSYIYGLFENDEQIDQTSLDEMNINLATELFFGEFGYKDCKHMGVCLIEERDDEDE